MNHGSLFSGIGGFDLAAQWMNWTNIFHCEWNPFCQRVLKHHFPQSISYEDITKTDFAIHRGHIDVLSGGFPCQPFSNAGMQKGTEDERYLWGEMLRAIREIKPRWVVGENVLGLVSWNDGMVFEQVCADLEVEGYEVQPYILPASGKNAPHKRERVWFVAYASDTCATRPSRTHQSRDTHIENREDSSLWRTTSRCASANSWEVFPNQPPFCGGDDGIPRELDSITFPKWRRESIRAYGNAIVPQVALEIFKSIQAYENLL